MTEQIPGVPDGYRIVRIGRPRPGDMVAGSGGQPVKCHGDGWRDCCCIIERIPDEPQPPDWVTQDRVPARPGIDQRRWVKDGKIESPVDDWRDAVRCGALRHGHTLETGNTLELRCLRSDLPECPRVVEFKKEWYEFSDGCGFAERISPKRFVIHHLKDGYQNLGEYDWNSMEDGDVASGRLKQITESEALARITKPAKTCTMCNGPADLTDDSCKQCNELAIEQVCGVNADLKIFMTVDGVLYCDTKPRTPLHKRVMIRDEQIAVIPEVSNG